MKRRRIRLEAAEIRLVIIVIYFIIIIGLCFVLHRLERENQQLRLENEGYKANIGVMDYDYGDHYTKCYWRKK